MEGAKKKFTQGLKKLNNGNQNVVLKIKILIDDFVRTLPLIEKLKSNSNFKDCHWEMLMHEIGF